MAQYMLMVYAEEVEPAQQAEREIPAARWGTIEVRPVAPVDEWANLELSEDHVRDLS